MRRADDDSQFSLAPGGRTLGTVASVRRMLRSPCNLSALSPSHEFRKVCVPCGFYHPERSVADGRIRDAAWRSIPFAAQILRLRLRMTNTQPRENFSEVVLVTISHTLSACAITSWEDVDRTLLRRALGGTQQNKTNGGWASRSNRSPIRRLGLVTSCFCGI